MQLSAEQITTLPIRAECVNNNDKQTVLDLLIPSIKIIERNAGNTVHLKGKLQKLET